MKSMCESVIVSINVNEGREDCAVVCVGKKVGGTVQIINAFQGQEAINIYRKLTERSAT